MRTVFLTTISYKHHDGHRLWFNRWYFGYIYILSLALTDWQCRDGWREQQIEEFAIVIKNIKSTSILIFSFTIKFAKCINKIRKLSNDAKSSVGDMISEHSHGFSVWGIQQFFPLFPYFFGGRGGGTTPLILPTEYTPGMGNIHLGNRSVGK